MVWRAREIKAESEICANCSMSDIITMYFQTCCHRFQDSEAFQWHQWLYSTDTCVEIIREPNHAFQFHLCRAILCGQRAIWLMCKKVLSFKHWLSQQVTAAAAHVLWSPGALIWRSTGSVMIAVPDRPRATRHPVTSVKTSIVSAASTKIKVVTELWFLNHKEFWPFSNLCCFYCFVSFIFLNSVMSFWPMFYLIWQF